MISDVPLGKPIRTDNPDYLCLLAGIGVVSFFWRIKAVGMPQSLKTSDQRAALELEIANIPKGRHNPGWYMIQED